MTTPSMIATSTSAQRVRILGALRDANLPVTFITDEHATVLARAELPVRYATHVDAYLRGLSYAGAARLLNALRQIEEPA